MGKEIYHSTLRSLAGKVIDITGSATINRFRLFDCDQFANHNTLRIYEFTDISNVRYAAISYVWRGTPLDAASRKKDKLGTFDVKGAEDADPISIDVLLHICKAACQENLEYIWMDKIGVMQTHEDDKHWQIQQMHDIYKGCDICFVLPGGVRRLVDLKTPTPWMHRGWTLQEVMAPKRVKVIFAWTYSRVIASGGTAMLHLTEITPFECAMCELEDIFETTLGQTRITTQCGHEFSLKTSILGASDNLIYSLVGAMREQKQSAREQAIWKSAFMRTSSRPVDMVFSIMGLFGVTLNPKSFDPDDRSGATIALARKIMENDGRASWLGPSYYLPPAKMLSAFPVFPRTCVSGEAYVEIEGKDYEVNKIMKDDGFWVPGIPKGHIDGAGYLSFRARGVSLLPVPGQHSSDPIKYNREAMTGRQFGRTRMAAMDGSVWQIDFESKDKSSHRHSAIYLGKLEQYTFGSLATIKDCTAIRALLVTHHGIGKVHRSSYFVLGEAFMVSIYKWNLTDFCLGGPEQ